MRLALEMTAKGDPIPAKKAQEAGLIDRIVGEGSLEADAIAFAPRDQGATPHSSREREGSQGRSRRRRGVQGGERPPLSRLRSARRKHRLRRQGDRSAFRRGHRLRTRRIHEADDGHAVRCTTPHFLRRTAGRQDRRRPRRYQAAPRSSASA
ncbi:MAG: hypothetical protein PGN08_09580 [Sphingomonas taxi]